MELGAFSISLGVKDLQASKAFYEKLGFSQFGGTDEHNYAIMKNGDTLVGLFQGMSEGNMLTFNPGWDQSAGEVNPFTDVREIKASLADAGVDIQQEQGGAEGPASFVVIDPDGNPILIDQHR
ncbi:VOC family protein [Octadecabacter sp. R77987]|uniref:VOC family protein n=1 Tax=Octadecabacter sp. R77987 TaxID=3093874 RepID=UPI0036707747